VLRSPIAGVVAERRTDVGERLGDNTVAFVVVQTAPLKLRFRVPERHLAAVHRGQVVSATVDPYPGEHFAGTVSVVGQVVDSASRSFFVESEFPNQDGRLRPGLFARVELALDGRD
jgi:membrane fusion protein (multidrug efflux system)